MEVTRSWMETWNSADNDAFSDLHGTDAVAVHVKVKAGEPR
jgi:hypothetical protein